MVGTHYPFLRAVNTGVQNDGPWARPVDTGSVYRAYIQASYILTWFMYVVYIYIFPFSTLRRIKSIKRTVIELESLLNVSSCWRRSPGIIIRHVIRCARALSVNINNTRVFTSCAKRGTEMTRIDRGRRWRVGPLVPSIYVNTARVCMYNNSPAAVTRARRICRVCAISGRALVQVRRWKPNWFSVLWK